MTNSQFRVIDGDGHIRERDSEICQYLDEPYKSSPNTLNYPFFPTLDGFQRGAYSARFSDKRKEGIIDAHAWTRLADEVNLEYAVVYPTAGLGVGMIQDPEWAIAVCRGYNNWIDAQFRQVDNRLRGVALLPLQDVNAAVTELRRAVLELGAVGAMLPANSANMGVRNPLGHESFWPLYEEAARLSVPVAVHGAPSLGLGFDFNQSIPAANVLEHPIAVMIQLTSMLYSGLYDVFPTLKVAYLEANTGWAPYMMDRLQGKAPKGITSPNDLMTSGRVVVSVEGADPSLPYAIERLGREAIIYATDYPHETVETVKEELDEALSRIDVNEDSRKRIYRENALDFYNWATPATSITHAELISSSSGGG